MSERRHKLWVMSTEECEWETEREKTLRLSLLHCVWLWRTRCLYKQSLFPLSLFISLFFVVSLCFAIFLPTCVLISCRRLILLTYFGSPSRFCSFLRCVRYSIVWFFIFLRRRCFVFVLFFGCLFLGFCDIAAGENQWCTGDICWFLFLFSLWPFFDEYAMFFGRLAKRGCGECGDVFVICLCWLWSVFFFCSFCVKWDQCCSVVVVIWGRRLSFSSGLFQSSCIQLLVRLFAVTSCVYFKWTDSCATVLWYHHDLVVLHWICCHYI